MRITQIIDSLEAGGAERMAVTIANSLVGKVDLSALVVTRSEGDLKATISDNVDYIYLKKKKAIDLKALIRFRQFVQKNKINIIHAHSSSYFFALLLKLTLPTIKLFWHDHLGNRVKEKKANFFIKVASMFFSGVFTVNQELKEWALQHLKTANIRFIPNYIEENTTEKEVTFLRGQKGKRIVLLANLRKPKNHILAINAFSKSNMASLGWTLHFIGKDNSDEYSQQLKEKIVSENLTDVVFIYGSCIDVRHILSQCDIGILTSTYEGFPVALLEYGKANLLVVTSNVGYCSQIIRNNETGICFASESESELGTIFRELANNTQAHIVLANNLNAFVTENYSDRVVVNMIISSYQN